jgi:hypothetical protein
MTILRRPRWIGDAPEGLTTLISRVVSLEDADANFAALAAGDGTPGKVLVLLGEGGGPLLTPPSVVVHE